MKYFAEFDTEGNKTAGYVADGMPWGEDDIREKFPNAVEISEEDQEKYSAGYIRGIDGKPKEKPAYVPTDTEVKQAKIDALNSNYNAQFEELSKSLGLASLANDTGLIAELRTEYTSLKTAYAAELEVINNG